MTNRGEELAERFVALMGELGGVGPALEQLEAEAEARGAAQHLQQLHPRPGDLFVLTLTRPLSEQAQQALAESLAPVLRGASAIFLDQGDKAALSRGVTA